MSESRLLLFETNIDTHVLSLNDQRLSVLCEDGKAQLSTDGDRLLCTPNSLAAPLKFIDRLSGSTIILSTSGL